MKLLKTLTVVSALVFMLAGCTGRGTSSSSSPVSSSASSSVISSSSSSSVSSSSSATSPSSSSSSATSSSSSTASSSSSSSSTAPAPVSKTALEVMEDICDAVFGMHEEMYEEDGYGGYISGCNFGTYGEQYLEMAVYSVESYLPEYLVEYEARHSGTWSDGSNGYFATYITEDYAVVVEIGSYVYNSSLCAQWNVYELSY